MSLKLPTTSAEPALVSLKGGGGGNVGGEAFFFKGGFVVPFWFFFLNPKLARRPVLVFMEKKEGVGAKPEGPGPGKKFRRARHSVNVAAKEIIRLIGTAATR